MSDKELPVAICKWKYKTVAPKQKHHTIDHYIKYITDQVEERRSNDGNFKFNSEAIIGTDEHDRELLKNFETDKYISYINERKGSHSLFSDGGQDLNKLEEELLLHKGTVWIPITSMKEKDAKEFNLLTEAQWIEKGRELAEEYRKILGIDKSNYHWVAAFHTKPEPDQNRLADAGAMPHLHFIIWEATPTKMRPNLQREQIAQVRTKTVSVLTKDYMKQQYELRNELKASLQEKAKDSLTKNADMIRNLILDIRTTTGGKGKLSVGQLEKRRDILDRIETKLSKGKELSDSEDYFLKSNSIPQDLRSVRQKLNNYDYILEQLDQTVDYCFKTELAPLLDQWLEVSNKMRAVQGRALAQDNTQKDLAMIKRTVQNAILNQAKDSSLDNRFITPALKGMMIEKLQYGQFKRGMSFETIQNSLETMTQLFKGMGLEREEVLAIGQELLDRSNMESYQAVLENAVKKKYDDELYLQYITTNDFWQAVKAMSLPVSRSEIGSLYQCGVSPYQMMNQSYIKPQVKTILDACDTKTILDTTAIKTVFDSQPSLLNIYDRKADDRERYKEIYNSLLDEYNNINQSDMEMEYAKDGER